MDNKPVLCGIIGLLLGAGIATYVASSAVNTNNTRMMQMMGMSREAGPDMMGDGQMGMGSSMEEMMESMEGKTGEDFDQVFMDAMTVHHQGAINMAQEALKSAGREEIRNMARDIIDAQTKEIEMMNQWRSQWGY